MYDHFYGLSGRPFQLTPDPNFYFESGTHRKAMSYLGYGLAQGEGFIVITGDVGAGKTTLVGHLMNTIDPSRLLAVKLVSTQVDGDDLLRLVCEQFGIDWDGVLKAELLRSLEQFLREQARAGRRTLLIVDEAQNLPVSALEELRMLSNFQLGGHSLLQIFLLGQPEFRQTLFHSPTLEQLRQRVIATHHLEPMEPEEIEPYILHRLGKVGYSGNPSFSQDAFEALFDHSEGVPRKLNVIVSRLLLYGAVEKLNRITAQHVRMVTAEISADRGNPETVADTAAAPPFSRAAKPAASDPASPPPPVMPDPTVATEPEHRFAPSEFTGEAEPHDDAAAPLEWPTESSRRKSASDGPPPFSVGAAPATPVRRPAARPAFGAKATAMPQGGLDRFDPLANADDAADADMLPPPSGASSFIEARSLVARQLGLTDPETAPQQPAPAPYARAATSTVVESEPKPEPAPELAAPTPPFGSRATPVPPLAAVVSDAPVAPPFGARHPVASAPAGHDSASDLAALRRQVAGLEARIVDQDAALRRVLDLLIDWAERDPAGAPEARTWAA